MSRRAKRLAAAKRKIVVPTVTPKLPTTKRDVKAEAIAATLSNDVRDSDRFWESEEFEFTLIGVIVVGVLAGVAHFVFNLF